MTHTVLASEFVANRMRASWHDNSLWYVRVKRDRQAEALPEWETLRDRASAIKANVLSRMDFYLEEFERNAQRLGAKVHFARNAAEHNQIVFDILRQHNVKRLVKSKSMLTEECHLNPFLERNGISVVDTDLGERIVQLAEERPSHIVLPAIHWKREEIGELFHKHLHTDKGATDPKYLAEAARQHLRECFLKADAGLTGVNFAIAETGGFIVCTNEGNADLGASLPKLHIACMGMEKLIPRAADLGVFLRLLGRSATGQPITAFSSHFHGPQTGGELHIVIVDNGRTEILGEPEFRRSLNCIRCGACMNTCPVYRRSGGHSYDATVPGPIGSVLSPSQDIKKHYSLPYACSLCGSCDDVCPVKIDLHHQLLAWRKKIVVKGILPWPKRMQMRIAGWVFNSPSLYNLAGYVARSVVPRLPRFALYNSLNAWGKQRELPEFPKQSFREQFRQRKKGIHHGDPEGPEKKQEN